MKNFHDYYFSLTAQQRDQLVADAGTTIGYAERIAGGYRRPSLQMGARLIKASRGKTSYAAMIETYERRNGPLV